MFKSQHNHLKHIGNTMKTFKKHSIYFVCALHILFICLNNKLCLCIKMNTVIIDIMIDNNSICWLNITAILY